MNFDEIKLNNIFDLIGSKKKKKRLGRGISSGKGKTAGRGAKGQKSRSGVSLNGFEGGQQPIFKRLPKRGFNTLKKKKFQIITIDIINQLIDEGSVAKGDNINKDLLVKIGKLKSSSIKVKLLGNTDINANLNFSLDAFSEPAKLKVEQSGGKIT